MKRKADMNVIDMRWGSSLPPDCRPRQLNRIWETLKKCFPNCASVDLIELNKMAEWFEEEMYTAATSHSDYLHKVYLKLLNMETRFLQIAGSQVQTVQLSQNVQNTTMNAGVQSSASLPPALPSTTSLTQTSMPNAAGQRINMQSGIAQNFVGSSVNQGLPSDIFSNTQWQMPGRHQLQQFASQQRQQQSQNPQCLNPQCLYHQQRQQGNIQSSVMQSHIPQQPQQQPQNLLQPTQMSNAVGRSTNMQSEIAQKSVRYVMQDVPSNIYSNGYAQYLFQRDHQLSSCLASMAAQTGQTGQNAVDWQEEIYQEIQAMKEKYLPDLNDMFQKITIECRQQIEHKDPVSNVAQGERLKLLNMLERHIQFLKVSKINILPAAKDKLSVYEKQIIRMLNSNRPQKPVSSQQQIQQPGGHPLSTQPQQQQQQEEEEADNLPDENQ